MVFSLLLPETIRKPSGEIATLQTEPACPVKVRIKEPLTASQILMVLSKLPETIFKPSGENDTLGIELV